MSGAITAAMYNPHLLARADLVASFVARRPLLDHLVDDLRHGGHQHHLLVGARGSGKTTLLLRLAVAIEEDRKLARAALPLRFPEEQYNVSRPSDFWLNCLDALADVLEARGDHAAKRDLESSVAAIEALSEDDRTSEALAALTQWARQADRLLVLLVDNLGLILERLRDSQWGLREALSRDNRLVLIGASSGFLEEAVDYQSPLYDFFNVHELGQLSEEEAREVVAAHATRTGATAVQTVLENDPGRFKALYVLTGGMPRMLALLASVLSIDSGPAESDLERLLDQLTPYYKARFDELPPQAQILIDAVALHWHPITAAACAERTRLEVNVVSAQLNRLVKLGLLTKMSFSGASKLGFQLVERFFNIWYLMRASRRARQKLAWFTEFLRMFYREEELSRRAQKVLDRHPDLSSPTHVLALAAAVPDTALRRRLECRAVMLLVEGIRSEPIHELLDLGGVDAHLSPVVDRTRALARLRARLPANPKLQRLGSKILRDPLLLLAQKASYIDQLAREGPETTRWRAYDRRPEWWRLMGEQLLAAVEHGEVPSLMEVRSTEEAAAVIDLARSSGSATANMVAAMILGLQYSAQPVGGTVASFVIEHLPEGILLALGSAAEFVKHGEWASARDLARCAFQRGVARRESPEWEMTIHFFHACARSGHAANAAELVAELGLHDRWLPLYEALLIDAGDRDRRSRLAPEVAAPTEEILALLQRPSSVAQPRPSSRERTTKRPARKPARRGAAPRMPVAASNGVQPSAPIRPVPATKRARKPGRR